MAQNKTAEQILAGILGPPIVIGGAEILGPIEARLLDELRSRVAVGISDFTITWGPDALRMPREMRAAAALEILKDKRARSASASPARPQVNVRDLVAAV